MRKTKEFKWPCKEGKKLIKVFLKLKTEQDMEKFLRDICTISELQAMTERWQAARLIEQNVPYRKIANDTGLSTATITRVAYWMKYGKGGYQKVLRG